MREAAGDPREAYEAFADHYDEFNRRYMYERWTTRLLEAAEGAGLRGRRLLDVGCGTGLSLVVPLRLGFAACGSDISPRMLAHARRRLGEEVRLEPADMRALPRLGEFDLIWSVNDSMNYLASGAELEATLAGMRRNLAPGGVIVFDLNTTEGYRRFWSGETVVEGSGGRLFAWRGDVDPAGVAPGEDCEARLMIDGEEEIVHRQRHLPKAEVFAAIGGARLRCLAVHGEADGELSMPLEESRHTKAVYVATARTGAGARASG